MGNLKLPETNSSQRTGKNGGFPCSESPNLQGIPLFSGALAVSFKEKVRPGTPKYLHFLGVKKKNRLPIDQAIYRGFTSIYNK